VNDATISATVDAAAPPGPLREFWGYFSANRGAVAGLVIVVAVLSMAAFADVLAPYPPNLTNNAVFLQPPAWQAGGSWAYPLGTDAIGRDIVSRLIFGARLSLLIGIAVVALSIVVGIVLGLVAGFARGVTEIAIMRLMDIILTLPSLLLAIVIVAILGPGLMNAMLAVAVVVLPHYVRITRAAVITETAKDYVTAARANGAGRLRLMFSEVLPNCAAPLIVQASLGVSTAILDAAALGFLGLGAQPPASEWGTMLADARARAERAGEAHVRFVQADAQVHAFERGHFDLLFSRFGVMFFESAVMALRNAHRALKPGGRVCLIVWRTLRDNPCWGSAKEIALSHLPPPGEQARTCGPGPFSMADEETDRAMLKAAGFDRVELFRRIDAEICIGTGVEEAIDYQILVGPAGEIVREAGEEGQRKLERIRAEMRALLEQHRRGDGSVWMPSSTWAIMARKD